MSPAHLAIWSQRDNPCAACGGEAEQAATCDWCRGSGRGGYLYYDWIDLLNWRLVELAARKGNRFLIVEAPVRHGKSELTTRSFPAWYIGRFPHHRAIVTGYNDEFARGFGRANRDLLHRHGHHFGVEVSAARSAANEWDLTWPNRGGLLTVGVGNPPTGRGGNLIVIDDPIADDEQAYSETYRNKLWRWWQFSVRTRLEPRGIVVIIMSRWHEDDLVGRLLKRQEEGDWDEGEGPVDHWDVLHLPAIAEPTPEVPDLLGRGPGVALCPERYDEDALHAIRQAVGPLSWEALYQGRPTTPEGDMFPVSKWNYADGFPHDLVGTLRWRFDLAATEKERSGDDPDWTAGVLMARGADGRTFVVNAVRTRANDLDVEKFVRNTVEASQARYNVTIPVRIARDPGQAGKAQRGHWTRTVMAGLVIEFLPETGDKVVRAAPWASQQQAGNVWLVRGAWNEEYVEEHRLFPHGSHDDWVDASALDYDDLVTGTAGTGGKYQRTGARRGRR